VRKFVLLALIVPALAPAVYDMEWFDLNHWRAPFYNDGRWGIDVAQGGVAGGSWPRPLNNCYVFGAGVWVGAILPSPTPETLCTYTYDPNSGGTEAFPALCRHWRGGSGRQDRIYRFPGDWPPPHDRFPMAPQNPRSDLDLWCCLCDSEPDSHNPPGRPLGIDLYLTVYGLTDSLAQDFFYLKYELANCSGDTLGQTYFGVILDADIGDAADDMTGLILDHVFHIGADSIRVRNTGFVYDHNNVENPGPTWESGTPGAVAVMLLSSPDSVGLTAFKKLTIDIDPKTDAAQYLTLAGYDYRTGIYSPYDSIDITPGDKRALLATGPFQLAPDSVLTFWYAVIGSPFGDSAQPPEERDTNELARRCRQAEDHLVRVSAIVQETMNDERGTMNFGPTIVSGVLNLPKSASTSTSSSPSRLLDISGRSVMTLEPGANDVRSLAPGIYFVVTPSPSSSPLAGERAGVRGRSAVSGEPSALTKVVVTK